MNLVTLGIAKLILLWLGVHIRFPSTSRPCAGDNRVGWLSFSVAISLDTSIGFLFELVTVRTNCRLLWAVCR